MPEINSDYCSECICHEDGTRHPDASGGGWTEVSTTSEETNVLCIDDWIGDCSCEDVNNHPGCEYDGGIATTILLFSITIKLIFIGDCCLPEIQSDYCIECICHEDGTRHPDASQWDTWNTGSSSSQTTTEPANPDTCRDDDIGDGWCDDVYNIPGCEYDGGIITT